MSRRSEERWRARHGVPARPSGRAPGYAIPGFPEPGTVCSRPAGDCDRPALPGRWSCAEHAALLERRGEELRRARLDRADADAHPFGRGGRDRTANGGER